MLKPQKGTTMEKVRGLFDQRDFGGGHPAEKARYANAKRIFGFCLPTLRLVAPGIHLESQVLTCESSLEVACGCVRNVKNHCMNSELSLS